MDFVSDRLFDGRRRWVLTLVGNHMLESLVLSPGRRIGGMDVVGVLENVTQVNGFPKRIKLDNRPECIPKDVDRWASLNVVGLDSSRPGKPSDNALIKPFGSRFRQECINAHGILALEDARSKIGLWRKAHYSERSY